MANQDLLVYRDKIDAIDEQILALLSSRAACAKAIGHIKQNQTVAMPFYRPEREKAVLERLMDMNPGPLPDKEIRRLFREVMSACLALEMPMDIAYLGPEGTYTQAAVLKQFGHSVNTVPLRTIPDVFKAVQSENAHFGIVPSENSTEGVVTHTLDMLLQSDLRICGEILLRIQHNLLSNAESLSAVKAVYAHEQALAQCRNWLNRYIPHADLRPVSSNGKAAEIAATEANAAAIAGQMASDFYGLSILAAGIEDETNNTTRFLVIGNQQLTPTGDDKTSLVVSANNHPGLLHQLLEPIARYKVNMTRLESRPARQAIWEYVFFIDLEGHEHDEKTASLLAEIKRTASFFKVLGSYPVGTVF
ncbi:prephenate dehydratase [Ostreibacterium oceani]|uniref:Bifunctional chorismate mutase/prephenate dehydratase n=1 Tax=Ostreibacterium oceani TaxID=2654998 RepID=A0A6N7EW12_9GAMM|nr:prephenate dehydratase [Ostreibacterium oceani]MPV86083.1 prephenate dehydratase [Ostreibacterium oceani]